MTSAQDWDAWAATWTVLGDGQPGLRMDRHEENLDTLRQLLPAPFLGDIPNLPHWQASDIAGYLELAVLLNSSCTKRV